MARSLPNPNKGLPVLEGDIVIKEVDHGGKNVHLGPPPNSEVMVRIRKKT